ncbi:MAG: energy transducer TonB [Thermoanaerobaculia bacterium]
MTTAYAVTGILDRRLHTGHTPLFGRFLAVALGIHFAVAVVGWWIPRWTRAAPPPIEFVAVQVVPAARLGVARPVPPKPRPPEVEKEQPRPVEPPPAAAPSLPKPAEKPAAKPTAAPATPKPQTRPDRTPPEPQATPEVRGSERGSVSGLAMGASVAGLDNPDFTYGYYVDQMLSMIQANWVRPIVGSGIEATISYRIGRDGRITDVAISSSSGINSFDLAALRAVQSASPLPPLPRAFRESWLGVHLIFR